MILNENQRVNAVVRGLIFKDNHLLVTQWRDGRATFPIGGRVEFGERLVQSLRREVFEETGAQVTDYRLVYFVENLFTIEAGSQFHMKADTQFHEYGWFFWVETERPVCGLDEVLPNPDHPDLIIRYLALDEGSLSNFWPPFLPHYLPADWSQGFAQNPRYVLCRQNTASGIEVRELEGLFPHLT